MSSLATKNDSNQHYSRQIESTKKKIVMVVEDDDTLRSLSEKRLIAAGYDVVTVHDGQAAIDRLANGDIPDLVLLDIMMPGIDGFEVLDLIAIHPLWTEIPVIVLSHLSGKNDIDLAFSKGAKEFLIKSHCTLSDVLVKIRRYID